MIRVILLLCLLAALALAGAWLAERPGDVSIVWMDWQIDTTVTVAAAAFLLALVAGMMLWSTLRLIFRSPRLIAQMRRERRERRGQRAISRGLLAVASGDTRAARRFAGEAERFATEEPLALLLRAQNAQLAGDRAEADAAFRAMTEQSETRLLGLRGLYVEAQRRGDVEAGRRFAEEAVAAAPALPWAGQAVFDLACAGGDWNAALAALDRNLRNSLVDRAAHRRQRAVLLTARALEREAADPESARAQALEAVKLVPDLVPAAALAARLLAEGGDWRRAAKLVEAAWRTSPHPDLAEVYAYLRPGRSARERMARVQGLARLLPAERESALALARAALDALDFAAARGALAPFLPQPTRRVALLMAELEEAEHGDSGRAREWMARALRLGGDPRWIADGLVSERWLPVSPATGRLDAFVWAVPAPEIAGPGFDAAAAGGAAMRPLEPPAEPAVPAEPAAAPGAGAAPAPPASSPPAAVRREAVIPLIHAPDDPGPEPDPKGAATPGVGNGPR